MGITATFSQPYFTGGGIEALVPSIWPIALNGRPYMLDTLPETFYVRWNSETIPLIRQQADAAANGPAEASLNPEGLWRRAQDSWHHGAGQNYRDRDSQPDPYRFKSSKGIDPWTRYQISLLHDTTQSKSSANTNLYAVVAGARLYLADGAVLRYTTDLITYNTVTYAGGSIQSLTTDGFNVYVGDGSDIYLTNTGITTTSAPDTTNANLIRYVKGRLMVAAANVLYNVTTLGSAATMTYTHPNTNFTWVDCAEGTNVIYAAGFSGDKSQVFRTAIKADGTALDIPTNATPGLPSGEIIRSIYGYLGFVFLGTDKGIRLCEAASNGDLTIGPFIPTPGAVSCITGQDRFVYFGWTNYDGVSTGLGRIDITAFTNPDQPAYASDLMVTGSGAVSSVRTFLGVRVFTVQGLGIYNETATLVASGTIDMGCATFGLPDPKTAIFLHIDTDLSQSHGTFQGWLQTDADGFVEVGSATINKTSEVFPTNQSTGDRFEVRLVLNRASTTTGPVMTRWTLKVVPSSSDGPAEVFHIPLMLYPTVEVKGNTYKVDVALERREISQLRQTRELITYQEFHQTYTGFISDFKFYPYGLTDEEDGSWGTKGTLLCDFQRVT